MLSGFLFAWCQGSRMLHEERQPDNRGSQQGVRAMTSLRNGAITHCPDQKGRAGPEVVIRAVVTWVDPWQWKSYTAKSVVQISQNLVWLQLSLSRDHRRRLALTQGSQTPGLWKDMEGVMIRLQTLGEVDVGLPHYTFGGMNWLKCSRTQGIIFVKLHVIQWKGKYD